MVRRVVAQKLARCGTTFLSPVKRYNRDQKKIVMDGFDTEALRRTIHDFYHEKYPTLDSIHQGRSSIMKTDSLSQEML